MKKMFSRSFLSMQDIQRMKSVLQLLRVNFHVQPNQIRPRTKMWRQEPGSTHSGKLLYGLVHVFLRFCIKRYFCKVKHKPLSSAEL